jgi:O-antigen ligase
MMKDHPVLGVGYFNFVPYYTRHHFDDIIIGSAIRAGQAQLPHNIFIQVGTDAGFLGLGVFLTLIGGAFFTMRRIGKEATARGDLFMSNLPIGMNLSLVGFVVGGQFVTVTYYPYLWIHLAFVTMMYTFWRSEQASLAKQHPDRGRSPLPRSFSRGRSPG